MEIDWTVVAFEALNFGILVLILKRFLFKPVRETLENRRRDIESQRAETESREAAAAALREEYERKLHELETEIRQKTDAAIAKANERAGTIMEGGREQARELVTTANQECEQARKRALEQLRLEVFALSVDAATRVVRHMGAPSVALAYARRAAHDCQEILEGLDTPLSEPIALFAGPEVDPDEVTAELRSVLGAGVRLTFEVDPDIVAGVRLEFAGHEVEASASMALRSWYRKRIEGETGRPRVLERVG